jgi:hypothetical protein
MAKHRKAKRHPKPKHNKKCQRSRHDKRERLNKRNAARRHTEQPKFSLVGSMLGMVATLARSLDPRTAFRLSIICSGMLLADDRRTASSWFVAAGVLDDWDRYYDCLISLGRITQSIAGSLLIIIIHKFAPQLGERILIGIDDSPSARYGKHVEGAGVHHNPTPGPAGGEFLYGHNWVTLAWLQTHPLWGTIALPLLSKLYVRQVDIPALDTKYGWKFRTKHELAFELVQWFTSLLKGLGYKFTVWVVFDGAYAARPLLLPLLELGVIVVSRLRKDAVLHDLPGTEKNRRGPKRKYGVNKIDLKKLAASRNGWTTITYMCRGERVTRKYKTFLATSQLVSGVIRVVLLQYESGIWAPYFCTDSNASVLDILTAVGDRWAIEEQFHDVKEVWGAGQQQVRSVWSNIACWHLNQWMFTLVELCSWDVPAEEIVDRSDRSWDNPHRRPSHGDKKRRIAREMLGAEINRVLVSLPDPVQIQRLLENLLALCV